MLHQKPLVVIGETVPETCIDKENCLMMQLKELLI